jgi:hypothetical protein
MKTWYYRSSGISTFKHAETWHTILMKQPCLRGSYFRLIDHSLTKPKRKWRVLENCFHRCSLHSHRARSEPFRKGSTRQAKLPVHLFYLPYRLYKQLEQSTYPNQRLRSMGWMQRVWTLGSVQSATNMTTHSNKCLQVFNKIEAPMQRSNICRLAAHIALAIYRPMSNSLDHWRGHFQNLSAPNILQETLGSAVPTAQATRTEHLPLPKAS